MADKEKTRYYWNKSGGCFAGKKRGADVTDYFKGEDDPRLKKFIELGEISTKKPETVEVAKETELHQLRKTVEAKEIEIAELKEELDSTPKTVREAREKIKQLQAQVDELTDPKKSGSK